MSEEAKDLQAIRRTNPPEYVRLITAAFEEADGKIADAAEKLGVSKTALKRWLREDSALRSVRRRRTPGRPCTKVDPKDQAKIVALRRRGVPRREVAAKFNVGERYVTKLVERAG